MQTVTPYRFFFYADTVCEKWPYEVKMGIDRCWNGQSFGDYEIYNSQRRPSYVKTEKNVLDETVPEFHSFSFEVVGPSKDDYKLCVYTDYKCSTLLQGWSEIDSGSGCQDKATESPDRYSFAVRLKGNSCGTLPEQVPSEISSFITSSHSSLRNSPEKGNGGGMMDGSGGKGPWNPSADKKQFIGGYGREDMGLMGKIDFAPGNTIAGEESTFLGETSKEENVKQG